MFKQEGFDPRSAAIGVGRDSILYAGWRERCPIDPFDSRVAFYRSEDYGQTWIFVSEVATDEGRVCHRYGKAWRQNKVGYFVAQSLSSGQ